MTSLRQQGSHCGGSFCIPVTDTDFARCRVHLALASRLNRPSMYSRPFDDSDFLLDAFASQDWVPPDTFPENRFPNGQLKHFGFLRFAHLT